MKKTIICVLMMVAVLFSFAACSSKSVEGIWLSEDGKSGYKLGELGELNTGEKMGTVELQEKTNDWLAVITYRYRFTDDNKIEIIRYSPSFSGNSVGVNNKQYDLLRIEGTGNDRVLVSEKSGERYYYQGN